MKQEYVLTKPEYIGSFTKRTELTTIRPTFWRRILKPIGWKLTNIGNIKTTRNKNQVKFEQELSYRRVTLFEHIWEEIKRSIKRLYQQ